MEVVEFRFVDPEKHEEDLALKADRAELEAVEGKVDPKVQRAETAAVDAETAADQAEAAVVTARQIAADAAWGAPKQAAAQGFWAVYSSTPPAESTMYGVPVVWFNVPAAPAAVPVLPVAPLWNDALTQATIPSGLVGVEYRLGTTTGGQVLPQGSIVPGVKGAVTTITARALPGYVLPTTFAWAHMYLDPTKATLVASDTFTGAATPTLVGRTLNNALGGSQQLSWRTLQMTANPLWTPPNLNWTGKGYTGIGLNGSGSIARMDPPVSINPTVVGATTGGTLAAGTYWYMVTAPVAVGETGAINQKSVALTGSTSSATLSWTAVTGATGYRIWRGNASGQQKLLTTLAAGVLTFTDDGSLTPGTATPPYLDRGSATAAHSGLMLSTSWQRLVFTVSGIAALNNSVTVKFRTPTSWTPSYSGYSVQIDHNKVVFGPGKDVADAAAMISTDFITYAHAAGVNGTWDVYLIGDTMTAVAPNGSTYTVQIKPYTAGTAGDRVIGNGLTFGFDGTAVVSNVKVYEVGA
jgi:hypothetical protein